MRDDQNRRAKALSAGTGYARLANGRRKEHYPLLEVLRWCGVKNVCVDKGLPGLFIEEYCHTGDLNRAAADFADLNFVAFHNAFRWEVELAAQAKGDGEESLCGARLISADDANGANGSRERYAVLIGNLLDGFGPITSCGVPTRR